MYKAIFFDRDGTLSRGNSKRRTQRNQYIGHLIGDTNFELTQELNNKAWGKMHELHEDLMPIDTLDKEKVFWTTWYEELLKEIGVKENVEAIAHKIEKEFYFASMCEPFEEVRTVLAYFKERGYKMGVISDTFPSLEESIKAMGLGEYFDTYTASEIVGVMKPDPLIYNTALESLGVKAEESIYVDDYDVEADGARNLGFLAFHIKREQEVDTNKWEISSLERIITYLEAHGL